MTGSSRRSQGWHQLAAFSVAAVGLALGAAQGPALAAPATAFLAHQAAYDLSLLKARGNRSVDAASGQILYSFSGNECDGYTTDFRQLSKIDSDGGQSKRSDMRSTSWEDGTGSVYRFKIETRSEGAAASVVDGVAERNANGITVKLKQPKATTFSIDKETVFPTEQIRRIIDAALAGKSLLELAVYDGSDDGQKIYNTLTVIGRPLSGDQPPASADSGTDVGALKTLVRWPVTVSYYDQSVKGDSGEQTPSYAMSFELYENGVSRALKLDYNDFIVAGAMSKFDVKAAKPCK